MTKADSQATDTPTINGEPLTERTFLTIHTPEYENNRYHYTRTVNGTHYFTTDSGHEVSFTTKALTDLIDNDLATLVIPVNPSHLPDDTLSIPPRAVLGQNPQ